MEVRNVTDHINRIKLKNKFTNIDILYLGGKRRIRIFGRIA